MRINRIAAPLAGGLLLAACARSPAAVSSAPFPAERYEALADTVVCVVDRSSNTGLRDLPAKVDDGGSLVLLAEGEIVPLTSLHPTTVIAGYAGAERWLERGDPLPFRSRRYIKADVERRVPVALLSRVGDHQGVPLFAAPDDPPPPQALYVPTRPGCIFQAYVREDLLG